MSDRQRNEGGEFIEKVTENDVIGAFRDAEGPVVTAAELARALDMTRHGARDRLNRMRESGLVDRKEVGARAVVWWLADDE